MASGYGIHGGESRCFAFWQAVAKCYAETDRPGKCTLFKEDYNECLHHRKARAKSAIVKAELSKIRQEGVEEIRRQSEIYKSMGRAGGVSVGLIERIIAKSAISKLEGTNQPSDEELIRRAKAEGGDDYNRIDFELMFPGPPKAKEGAKGKEVKK